jgi:hypothetical protein
MVRMRASHSTKTSKPLSTDGLDGSQITNSILRSLPRKERAQFFSSLEFVRLKLRQVLHEVGETIRSGYFLKDSSACPSSSDSKPAAFGWSRKQTRPPTALTATCF